MLEPLAGLKWEQTANGIRVERHAPLDSSNLRRAILICVSFTLYAYLLGIFINGSHRGWSDWKLPLLYGPAYMAAWIWRTLARRTILTLTPKETTLNIGTLEIGFNKRVFANSRLHNLYYCGSRDEPTAEQEIVKNCLLCDVEDKTISIMSGITSEEAYALIDRMMEIYKFTLATKRKMFEH